MNNIESIRSLRFESVVCVLVNDNNEKEKQSGFADLSFTWLFMPLKAHVSRISITIYLLILVDVSSFSETLIHIRIFSTHVYTYNCNTFAVSANFLAVYIYICWTTTSSSNEEKMLIFHTGVDLFIYFVGFSYDQRYTSI